jgi:hypothetical protein
VLFSGLFLPTDAVTSNKVRLAMVDFSRENRIEVLRQGAVLLERENERLTQRVQKLMGRVAELEHQTPEQLQVEFIKLQEELTLSRRALFGERSERRPRIASEPIVREAKPRSSTGPTAQPALRGIEEIHDLDEPDKMCPKCRSDAQAQEVPLRMQCLR